MLVLIGIVIIIAGFLLRFNPLLVIMASALATGLAAGLDVTAIIAAFGKAFNDTRYVSIVWIVLPVIGLLEAYGLQQHARSLIDRMKGATLGRLLTSYLLLRQAMSAIGLHLGRDFAAGGAANLPCARDRDECEDEQAVLEIAQIVAAEHREGEQAPEGSVAEAFRVGAVVKAEEREEREGPAGENIDEIERDHAPASRFRIRLSRRRRRKPWIRKAAIAVGIAQSERWSGSIL